MNIIAQCPKCGNGWQLEEVAADRRITCPECKTLFKIPRFEELPKAIRVIEQIN